MSSDINRTYPVIVGENVFKEIDKFISLLKPSSVFILTDENVNKHCLPLLLSGCENLGSAIVIEIPAGEEEKNITTSAKIISMLLSNNADRKCLLVNLGGGVVSDIGGFVASVYKRGIEFINIPTTLLSMVDASIGGKNGINFLGNKNVVGTFTNASAVFIYPDFTRTLLPEEKRSGFAEIVKHFLLSDATGWYELLKNPAGFYDEKNLTSLIEHSVKYKLQITNNDFREEGKRKILNFGHTIGHALESFSLDSDHPLRHGEAIAAGMIAELFLSFKLEGLPESEMTSSIHFIRNIFSDINLNCNPEDLIPYLYADKKNAHDRIAFSLLKSPGVPAGISFPGIELIVESIIFMIEEFSRTVVQ